MTWFTDSMIREEASRASYFNSSTDHLIQAIANAVADELKPKVDKVAVKNAGLTALLDDLKETRDRKLKELHKNQSQVESLSVLGYLSRTIAVYFLNPRIRWLKVKLARSEKTLENLREEIDLKGSTKEELILHEREVAKAARELNIIPAKEKESIDV